MSSNPSTHEVAAISIAETLTVRLLENAETGERIRCLRRQGTKLKLIATMIQGEFETARHEEISVLTSAVSKAARILLGDQEANEIAQRNRHSLDANDLSRGGKNSGVANRSAAGIAARGDRLWGIQDDILLARAIEECEQFHANHGKAFWYDVSRVLSLDNATVPSPKSCESRAQKLSLV